MIIAEKDAILRVGGIRVYQEGIEVVGKIETG
jgi:hypothetical protein